MRGKAIWMQVEVSIRKSQICVFAGRRGTPIRIGERLANATHFETELFHAALLGKQIHVFVANGYEPDPTLRGYPETWLGKKADLFDS